MVGTSIHAWNRSELFNAPVIHSNQYDFSFIPPFLHDEEIFTGSAQQNIAQTAAVIVLVLVIAPSLWVNRNR